MTAPPRPPSGRGETVGREPDLAAVTAALHAHRIVTIVGTGGVGKTRLAGDVAASWPGAATWVDLTVERAGGVASAAATALDVHDAAVDVVPGLARALGGQGRLLVLDGCEHVVDEVGLLVDELVELCPGLAVLSTSIEPLGVTGERLHPLAPLDVPAARERSPERVAACGAVRLLVARAQAAMPGFTLGPDEAADAARLCRRLDGLPLAIELAAARLRVLSVRQVADGLDDMFAVLGTAGRRAPQRHSTLRAALDWSHQLLSDDEQQVLRALSAFPGEFDVDAASAVTSAPFALLVDTLSRLVDKSFVRCTVANGTARYRLLEVIRQYAREHLRAAGEEVDRLRAHAEHYARVVSANAAALRSADPASALDRLEVELANLDQALSWLSTPDTAPAAVRTAASVWRFCYVRGHYRRGREWLEAAAQAASGLPETADVVDVRHGAGVLSFLECDYGAAVQWLESALGAARQLGDPERTAAALQMLGGVAREQGRYRRAEELYAESLALYEAAGSGWGVARAHNYLAFLAWLQRDPDAAVAHASAARAGFEGQRDPEGLVWADLNLAMAALLRGEPRDAASRVQAAAELAESVDFREGVGWTTHVLALAAAAEGDVRSPGLLRQAASIHLALGDRWRAASVLADLGCLEGRYGDPALAARLFGAADALWEAIGSGPAPYERAWQDRGRDAVRTALGGEAFAAQWRAGRTADVDLILEPGQASPPDATAAPVGDGVVPPAPVPLQVAQPSVPAQRQPPVLRVTALGAPSVQVGDRVLEPSDWGWAKPRELLLLLACDGPLSKERIAATLWPDLEPAALRNALHTALRDVRRALGDPGWVVFDRGRYQLDSARQVEVDVVELEAELATARACTDAADALPHLERAIALYRGDYLEGLQPEWADRRRDALRQAYGDALLSAGRAHAAAGRYRDAERLLARAVAHDPLLEAAHRDLMVCWVRAGEPGRAVRHYHELVGLLRDELGVAPAPQTRALFERIAREG